MQKAYDAAKGFLDTDQKSTERVHFNTVAMRARDSGIVTLSNSEEFGFKKAEFALISTGGVTNAVSTQQRRAFADLVAAKALELGAVAPK